MTHRVGVVMGCMLLFLVVGVVVAVIVLIDFST